MRFIVDECTGPEVARWLIRAGHNVFSVYDHSPGISDEEILQRALEEERVIITNDKDFGEKVYRDRHVHMGVVLLRLDDERSRNKIAVLQQLLEYHADRLTERFVVVTERQIRFASSR